MKTVYVTHGDCDGVCAGALAVKAFGQGKIFFSNPYHLSEDLKIANDFNRVFILDIALDQTTRFDLVKLLSRMSKGKEIIYVDHHPYPEDVDTDLLAKSGMKVIHDDSASASELAYRAFEDRFGSDKLNALRVAIFGAIGDYEDETRFIRDSFRNWDRRAIYLQSGVLIDGLEVSRKQHDFKRRVVSMMVEGELPTSNAELVSSAVVNACRNEEVRKKVMVEARRMGDVGYVLNVDGSLGREAIYAAVAVDARVGVGGQTREDTGLIEMSLRVRNGRIDLNKILRRISERMSGCPGGGHEDAAGARVPVNRFQEFLEMLNQGIEKT